MLHCLVAEWRRLETATRRQQPMEVRTTIPVLIVPPCYICLFGFATCVDTDSSTLQIYGEGHRGVWASTSPPHTRPCGEAAMCTSILPLLIKGNCSWCPCSCVALHTKAPKLVILEPCVCHLSVLDGIESLLGEAIVLYLLKLLLSLGILYYTQHWNHPISLNPFSVLNPRRHVLYVNGHP